jgi:hypothetical protein
VISDRLAQAAFACFIGAGLLLLAGILMLVTSKRTRPASS